MKHENSSPRLNLGCLWLGESRYSVLCPKVTFPSFHDLEFLICNPSWRVFSHAGYVFRAMVGTQKHRRKTSSLHRSWQGRIVSFLSCPSSCPNTSNPVFKIHDLEMKPSSSLFLGGPAWSCLMSRERQAEME